MGRMARGLRSIGGRSRSRSSKNLTISEKRAIAGRKGALARWGRRRRSRR